MATRNMTECIAKRFYVKSGMMDQHGICTLEMVSKQYGNTESYIVIKEADAQEWIASIKEKYYVKHMTPHVSSLDLHEKLIPED